MAEPNLLVQRLVQQGNATVGFLVNRTEGLPYPCVPACWTLEDIHRPKKVWGKTRIPAGHYRLRKRTWGGKFDRYRRYYGHEFVAEILDVPNYTDVLIHVGNVATNTEGCLLVATNASNAFPLRGADPSIGQSAVAYKALYAKVLSPLFAAVKEPTLLIRDETALFV